MDSPQVVLIVDDDSDQRTILRVLCERSQEKILVAEAASVDDAFHFLETNSCDLILADFRMPGRAGIELVRAVRQKAREREVAPPRVVLTTAGDCEEILLMESAVACCPKRQLLKRLPEILREEGAGGF